MNTRRVRAIKKFRKNWGAFILVALVIASAAMSGFFLGHAYGENYTFNMTKELRNETNILALCYNHEIHIDFIHEFCMERYGGIDTPFGDKIK